MYKTGIARPIVMTVVDDQYHDVTTEIRQAAETKGLKIDDWFIIGIRSRGGYLSYVGLDYTNNDDDMFDIPIGAQWDNLGFPMQILRAKIFVRSTQLTGDKIEFALSPVVGAKNA